MPRSFELPNGKAATLVTVHSPDPNAGDAGGAWELAVDDQAPKISVTASGRFVNHHRDDVMAAV